MTKKKFLKLLLTLQKESLIIGKSYELGIDLINFVDPYHEIVSLLIKEIYGKKGYDWFSWYCYDNDFGTKGLEAYSGKKRICYSHDTLWEYLKKYNKKRKK
jgi:hypothetical protein